MGEGKKLLTVGSVALISKLVWMQKSVKHCSCKSLTKCGSCISQTGCMASWSTQRLKIAKACGPPPAHITTHRHRQCTLIHWSVTEKLNLVARAATALCKPAHHISCECSSRQMLGAGSENHATCRVGVEAERNTDAMQATEVHVRYTRERRVGSLNTCVVVRVTWASTTRLRSVLSCCCSAPTSICSLAAFSCVNMSNSHAAQAVFPCDICCIHVERCSVCSHC